MVGKPGRATIDHGRPDELLPAWMREKAEETQVTAASQVAVNLGCSLLVLLQVRIVGEFRLVLNEQLLTAAGFKMHLLHQREQLFPGFAVGAAILSGIDGREFPPLAAGQDG